jgi:hypothetical protein
MQTVGKKKQEAESDDDMNLTQNADFEIQTVIISVK